MNNNQRISFIVTTILVDFGAISFLNSSVTPINDTVISGVAFVSYILVGFIFLLVMAMTVTPLKKSLLNSEIYYVALIETGSYDEALEITKQKKFTKNLEFAIVIVNVNYLLFFIFFFIGVILL